jgi:phage FluMu gp28-like protein
MEYKIYTKQLTQDEYFDLFDNQETLTKIIKDNLYNVYLVKSQMLNRDNFTCQLKDCPYCNNKKMAPNLTRHHVKQQKNGGKDTLRNSLTLCSDAHSAYHSGKIDLVISNNKELPAHIRGHVFKVSFRDKILARERKKKMKKFRKQILQEINYKENISFDYIVALISFLDKVWK